MRRRPMMIKSHFPIKSGVVFGKPYLVRNGALRIFPAGHWKYERRYSAIWAAKHDEPSRSSIRPRIGRSLCAGASLLVRRFGSGKETVDRPRGRTRRPDRTQPAETSRL